MTARLFTLDPLEGFRPKTFAGHRDVLLGAYFSADGKSVRSLWLFCHERICKVFVRSTQLVGMALSSHGKPNFQKLNRIWKMIHKV